MRKSIVFPVRYVAGKQVVASFSRELGEDGVSVLAEVAPAPGTIIGMQLYLPGAQPCAVTGLVGDERLDGALRSFWAQFTGQTRGSSAIIAALLGAGQRSSRRPAVNFKVACRIGERLLYETVENVSLGGVFVRAPVQPALDQVIEAHLELPDGKPPARVHARVAHASQRGFGLQFLDGDAGFRGRVEALVSRLCA